MSTTYLGNVTYVDFDGFALVLTVENSVAVVSERIVLEPDVWSALVRYVEELDVFIPRQ